MLITIILTAALALSLGALAYVAWYVRPIDFATFKAQRQEIRDLEAELGDKSDEIRKFTDAAVEAEEQIARLEGRVRVQEDYARDLSESLKTVQGLRRKAKEALGKATREADIRLEAQRRQLTMALLCLTGHKVGVRLHPEQRGDRPVTFEIVTGEDKTKASERWARQPIGMVVALDESKRVVPSRSLREAQLRGPAPHGAAALYGAQKERRPARDDPKA